VPAGLLTNVVRRGAPSRLLLLLHGFGADQYDLAPIAPHLDPEERFLVVCPRGPHAAPPGAAWYPFGGADPEAARHSVDLLDDLLDELCADAGMQREEAVIAGFSQGGSMALMLGLRASDRPRVAGVLCMSGFLADGRGVDMAWEAPGWVPSAADGLPPVLVQHGSLDPMVPVERGRAVTAQLAARGLAVRHHEYPMEHQLALESVQDAARWLDQVVAGERPSSPLPS
jgi:phospholipase/carboxylesterase